MVVVFGGTALADGQLLGWHDRWWIEAWGGLMRVQDCPIEVRLGAEGPSEFCWRGLCWQVQRIESRWIETAPWWDSPAARAVRTGGVEVDPDDDLLGETEFLRVVAGTGRRSTGSDRFGVFELAHTMPQDRWRLSRVID